MSSRTFGTGDCVRIRDWKSMESEFGLDSSGNINCQFVFTRDMKPLCGSEFTITEISEGDRIAFGHNFSGWAISADMLELVQDDMPDDTSDIENYLKGFMVV